MPGTWEIELNQVRKMVCPNMVSEDVLIVMNWILKGSSE